MLIYIYYYYYYYYYHYYLNRNLSYNAFNSIPPEIGNLSQLKQL